MEMHIYDVIQRDRSTRAPSVSHTFDCIQRNGITTFKWESFVIRCRHMLIKNKSTCFPLKNLTTVFFILSRLNADAR